MCEFFLGTHLPTWLWNDAIPDGIRLFVSHHRLDGGPRGPRKSAYPAARHAWALDSGGFTELQQFGEWRTTPREYVDSALRYATELGGMLWAAPQDWMCEPLIISGGQAGRVRYAGTGLSVAEHQRRTVANFIELQDVWRAATDLPCPFIPVLQGFTQAEYLACWDLYDEVGVELADYPLVGIGSVCRRQASREIAEIIWALLSRNPDLGIHAFGSKGEGLALYGDDLLSSDSLAWSKNGYHNGPMPNCRGHKTCANCPAFALAWMRRMLARPRIRLNMPLFALPEMSTR